MSRWGDAFFLRRDSGVGSHIVGLTPSLEHFRVLRVRKKWPWALVVYQSLHQAGHLVMDSSMRRMRSLNISCSEVMRFLPLLLRLGAI